MTNGPSRSRSIAVIIQNPSTTQTHFGNLGNCTPSTCSPVKGGSIEAASGKGSILRRKAASRGTLILRRKHLGITGRRRRIPQSVLLLIQNISALGALLVSPFAPGGTPRLICIQLSTILCTRIIEPGVSVVIAALSVDANFRTVTCVSGSRESLTV